MSGHIYLGYKFYKKLFTVSHEVLEFVLSVKSRMFFVRKISAVAHASFLRKQRIFFYFYAPALVFRDMYTEFIYFVQGAKTYQTFYVFYGHKVSSYVEHIASVIKSGAVGYTAIRQFERVVVQKLSKRKVSIKYALFSSCLNGYTVCVYVERIGLTVCFGVVGGELRGAQGNFYAEFLQIGHIVFHRKVNRGNFQRTFLGDASRGCGDNFHNLLLRISLKKAVFHICPYTL